MKSPSYLLVWNKKSQELFQLSHQLLGWSNSKIWIVHLLSVKTWFTDTERGHHQDNVYPSIHCTKIVLHKIWSEIVGPCWKCFSAFWGPLFCRSVTTQKKNKNKFCNKVGT